ncbi:response regulator [uncultured Sphingomonas sp.]|uniref:response regulator n=1 Tax=uncultured Sphingomonas sp. TaxID=158754 RepID=UPI00261E0896|nr:response regulator [uncultured Sphingomonas sp.]
MLDEALIGRRVLVVEDEYLLASDMANELEDAGAAVLGPVGTLDDAITAIEVDGQIDAVILDINLHGELALAAADLLLTRGIPFVFTTGYDEAAVPKRFAHIERCEKPTDMKRVTQAIGNAIRR